MKVIIKFLWNILLIIFLFSSKGLNAEEKIKIGLLAPFSGENSQIGKSIIQSVRMGINKIDKNNIIIVPRDTKSNSEQTLKVVNDLYSEGVKIFIGPIFNENLNELDQFKDAIFLSLTNKILNNPNNVISVGINAESQFIAIKKFLNINELKETLVLIPKKKFQEEIEEGINKSKFKSKKIFYYSAEPTKLTKQIEKVTKYGIRKQNLNDEIKRIEISDDPNKEKKIQNLEKRDTLGRIGYDSIVIADFDESLKSVTTSLLYTDVSPKNISFISLNQWFDESLFKEKTSQPISFPSINIDNFKNFNKEYKKLFQTNPSQIAILSYDIIGLIYYSLVQNNFEVNNKLFLKKNKFKGVSGIFEINQNNINHNLHFYTVRDSSFIKIF